MSGVDWLPAIGVLAAGLLIGLILVWRSRAEAQPGSMPSAGMKPVMLADLEVRHATLIDQLRELEDTAAKREPDQLALERYALELQAARVWIEIEDLAEVGEPQSGRVASAMAEPHGSVWTNRPALRGFLRGVGSMAAASLVVFLLAHTARPRQTTTAPSGESAGGAMSEAQEQRLQAILARNPNDLDARLDLARLFLARQDMMRVWSETKEVLARSPDHPRALAYQATVRVAMGQTDLAIDMLKKAIAADPNLFEAHVHLALAYAQAGRTAEAEAAFDQALSRFPEQAETLRPMREELKRMAPAVSPSPKGAARSAAAELSMGKQPAAPPHATNPEDKEKAIAGTVELDPSLLGKLPASAVVFIMIRDPERGGAPVAVERVMASSLPARFEIGAGSSMTGGALPQRMRIEARLDDDSNAATRAPSDPTARIDDVKAGQRDLRLILRRPVEVR